MRHIRLNNAINRGIEKPDDPAAVRRLILEGAAARYLCLTTGISTRPCIYVNMGGTVTAAVGKQKEE